MSSELSLKQKMIGGLELYSNESELQDLAEALAFAMHTDKRLKEEIAKSLNDLTYRKDNTDVTIRGVKPKSLTQALNLSLSPLQCG